MDDFNALIHQPTRLRIMAALSALSDDTLLEFTTLRDLLELTDGNLGTHLRTLEEAGYVDIQKTFVGRKPCTFITLTPQGRAAFQAHVRALETLIHRGGSHESGN